MLVVTTVTIERPLTKAHRGALARTGAFRILWEGDDPAGTTLGLRAGLSAEWFAPAFRTTDEGVIQRIQIVSRRVVWDANKTTVRPAGEWHLADVDRSPGWLGRSPPPCDPPEALHRDGLLIGLDLHRVTIPE